ncbi:MAG TPA: hypothetical protein VJT83_04180, partial [Chitinophagaceae bacterium]|nr:hypothetical protein [Chitinophagaceae bacterium]
SIYLFAKKQSIRFEMREKLEHQATVSIRVHHDSVYWVEVGKEIRINDKLFDIKNAEQDGEYIIFLGLFDEEEKEIELEMEKQTEENSSSTKLMKLISSLNFISYKNTCSIASIDPGSINMLHSWTEALPESHRSIDAPPPQV